MKPSPSARRSGCPALLCVWGAVLAAIVTLTPNSASAQAERSLDQSIVISENISNEQQTQIQNYIESQLQRLRAENAPVVADARQKLVIPMNNPSATARFLDIYCGQLIGGLGPVITSSQLLPRLNATITLSWINSPSAANQAVQMAAGRLSDDSAGVRYWAAQAIARIAQTEGVQLPQNIAQELLDRLREMVGSEASPVVLGQVFEAMLAMPTDSSRNAVLQALNQRLTYHVNNPRASYAAEAEAMRRLFQNLVASRNNNNQGLRELLRQSVIYAEVIAVNLQAQPQVQDRDSHLRLLGLIANSILPFGANTLGIPGNPPQMGGNVVAGNLPGVERDALTWKDMMTSNQWNQAFNPNELEPPQPTNQSDSPNGGNQTQNVQSNAPAAS